MTTTAVEIKAVARQLRALRRRWKDVRAGALVPWGAPWCSACADGRCDDSYCEGRPTVVVFVADELARIESEATPLRERLTELETS